MGLRNILINGDEQLRKHCRPVTDFGPKTAELIMELTGKVVKEKGLTTIMVTHNLRYAIEYGNRLIMMHQGQAILDKAGKDKDNLNVDDLLDQFNQISIETGN